MRQVTLSVLLLTALAGPTYGQTVPTPATPAAQTQKPTTVSPPAQTAQGGVTINALTGQVIERAPAPSTATNRANLATNASPALRPLTNAATGARSNITPVQLQNINRLAVDLHGLALPGRDRAKQEQSLRETLLAAPISSAKPSPEATEQLATALIGVVPSLNLTSPQRRQLAIDINLALNSGNLGPGETGRVVEDIRGLLRGVALTNPQVAEQLLDSVRSVVSQVQSTAASRPEPSADASSQAPVGQPPASESGQASEQSVTPSANPPR